MSIEHIASASILVKKQLSDKSCCDEIVTLYQTPLHLHLHLAHLGHPGGNVKVSLRHTLLCSTEGLMGFCAVVTVTPQWLLHMGDRGTSTERSEATTSATSRSACSECSIMKEELVDVKHTLAAQQLEMDTLRQLMESMRSLLTR